MSEETRALSSPPTAPPELPQRTLRASTKKSSDKWWWIGGFLFGFAVGLVLSLTYGWVLDPRPLPLSPANLAERDKEFYLRLIAAAYTHDGDEARARARLASLALPEVEQAVVDLTERYINEERDIRDLTALISLADALGQTSSAMLPFMATPTPRPTSTPTPAPTPTPRPTQTPTRRPRTPPHFQLPPALQRQPERRRPDRTHHMAWPNLCRCVIIPMEDC